MRTRERVLPSVAWMTTIFLSSCTVVTSGQLATEVARTGVSKTSFTGFWQDWWWLFVKGWHVTEFAILLLLLSRWLNLVPALLLAVSYAALDEFHQTFVPLRGGRFSDVLIDCSGIAVAAIVLSALRSRRKYRERPLQARSELAL